MRASSRFHYAWVVLAIGTLVGFGVIGMARFGYTVVLPTMQESLGLNNTQTGLKPFGMNSEDPPLNPEKKAIQSQAYPDYGVPDPHSGL